MHLPRKDNRDGKWAFNSIASFLQYQKERVERKEIIGGTLRIISKLILVVSSGLAKYRSCFQSAKYSLNWSK